MILALLFLPILTVSSNPFHKFPYVFLLDVGNEELEKVNTEQIRLSSPGGSLALRYPAIGNGDDIAHVRVNGIDFGTDLKANIVDGGPGYKYVVIVLMGNPGAAFDAVLTIQTVPIDNIDNSIQTLDNSSGSLNDNTDGVSEDRENNGADDVNDTDGSVSSQIGTNDGNSELTQQSSNIYNYVQAERSYSSDINDEDDENKDHDEEAYESHDENIKEEEAEEAGLNDSENDPRLNQPLAEKYTLDTEYNQSDNSQPVIVDQNLYDKYQALRDHLYNGPKVYSQNSIREPDPSYDAGQNYEERLENVEETYDYYEENYPGKYKDDNNNFADTGDSSAVPY